MKYTERAIHMDAAPPLASEATGDADPLARSYARAAAANGLVGDIDPDLGA